LRTLQFAVYAFAQHNKKKRNRQLLSYFCCVLGSVKLIEDCLLSAK
jgi:hypothetical protein